MHPHPDAAFLYLGNGIVVYDALGPILRRRDKWRIGKQDIKKLLS